jgi:hypothetical protein
MSKNPENLLSEDRRICATSPSSDFICIARSRAALKFELLNLRICEWTPWVEAAIPSRFVEVSTRALSRFSIVSALRSNSQCTHESERAKVPDIKCATTIGEQTSNTLLLPASHYAFLSRGLSRRSPSNIGADLCRGQRGRQVLGLWTGDRRPSHHHSVVEGLNRLGRAYEIAISMLDSKDSTQVAYDLQGRSFGVGHRATSLIDM